MSEFSDNLDKLYLARKEFLVGKNIKYGNSALNPLQVFSKHVKTEEASTAGILVRLDDKLSRIKNSDKLRLNDLVDIAGYIDLLLLSKGWTNYEDISE